MNTDDVKNGEIVDNDPLGVNADIAAPKPKKKKGKGDKKKEGKKLIANKLGAAPAAPAAAGHNSGDTGEVVQGIVDVIDEILKLDEQKKHIGKAQRDLRNRAKTEFGVMAGPLAHELRLRKMDRDVRIQFESGHHDLKVMSGFQFAMDLKPDTVARTEEEYVDPTRKLTVETIQREG